MQCTFIITALFFLLLLPPSSSTGTVIGALYSHPADDLPSSLPAPCPHLDPVALQPSLAESPMRACGARKQPAVSSPARWPAWNARRFRFTIYIPIVCFTSQPSCALLFVCRMPPPTVNPLGTLKSRMLRIARNLRAPCL
eukprot:GGOE01011303.1.p2 GENE.GGOE01011303.1~~GGOE01011303.1.p2  ORF type:complete len:140 (-),score=1.47 GGOE01011303.1:736-1155(-)